MGFDDKIGNYLIASQSILLPPHSFKQYLYNNESYQMGKGIEESLQELLKPFEGNLQKAAMQAALKYFIFTLNKRFSRNRADVV